MRVLITICLIVVAFDVMGLIWSAADEKPHEAYVALSAPPPRTMQDPKNNAYYLMVGFGASGAHPQQVGYEMWLEADQGDRYFDYSKETRNQARLDAETVVAVSGWRMTDLLAGGDRARIASDRPDEVLQARYQQWLTMPFEDRGYGLRGGIRLAEMFVEHRRYLAGAGQDAAAFVERLEKDFTAWRHVMAEARTLQMKMIATAAVDDDAAILAGLLRDPALPKPALQRLGLLARPLNYFEQSLRYAMQSEFVLGARRYTQWRNRADESAAAQEHADHLRWLGGLLRLPPDAFDRVGFHPPDSRVVRFLMQKQRTLNIYAKYYDAAIKVSDSGDGAMPKLADFAQTAPHTVMDYLMAPAIGPLDALIGSGGDPGWNPFIAKLRETDARLRLAGLQVMLRTPSAQPVPIRIALAGTGFYDPFSGIPMLWNAEKGVLYSVGRDGLDDGGDTQLDIVTAPLLQTEAAPAPARPKARRPAA
jgi:hypothetical protein